MERLITGSSYKQYLKLIGTHIKAYHTNVSYPNEDGSESTEGLPSLQALYGIYDSLLTAHKALCSYFGDVSNPTANTACANIPRGFTVAIDSDDSIVEYQYKKVKPLNGYTMYDIEEKAVSNVNANSVEYNSSSSYQNGTIGKALKIAETNIANLEESVSNSEENLSYLQGDVLTPRHFGAVGDGIHDDKPAFIAAISALNEGETLYIPNGVYLCVDLDIAKPIKIVGESKEKTIIYNNTSGKPCFKSSINYLEISNLQFKAIPFNTPGIDRTTNLYEENNGRSGLLYKGEYGTFHDIIGDDVRTIIWLGGDFLPLGITKKGNTVYNITSRRTCQCILGCQQENCTIRNISGSFYNFRDWNSQLPDGGLAYDDTDFVTGNNPAHIVYITVRPVRKGGIWEGNIYEDVDADEIPHSEIYDGNYSWSKNINISEVHSVSGSEAAIRITEKGPTSSSAISIKGIIGGELINVTAINASAVWMYSLKNYSVHNIVCLNNTSYRYAVTCQDDFYIIPESERVNGRTINYNCIINTVMCSGGNASLRVSGDGVCKLKNIVLDTNIAITGINHLFGLYGAYWVEIDGLRVTNPNSQIENFGGVALGGDNDDPYKGPLGYLRDCTIECANGIPFVGKVNLNFEISNCTPNHPLSPLNPTSNKMYELTPIVDVETDRNNIRENDVNADETFLTATIDNDKQVMITPLLLYGQKEQHFKLLVTNRGTQAIPVRCVTSNLTPVTNPNFDYVRSNVPIDWRLLDVNNTFEYEVWRKDRIITVIFNGNESPYTRFNGSHYDEVWDDRVYNIHLTSGNNTLTFGTIPVSKYETTIYLTIDDDANSVINLPASYECIGTVAFEDGKNYVITIKNGIITSNEILTGPPTPEPEPVENNSNT